MRKGLAGLCKFRQTEPDFREFRLRKEGAQADAVAEALAVKVFWARALAIGRTTRQAAKMSEVLWRIPSMLPDVHDFPGAISPTVSRGSDSSQDYRNSHTRRRFVLSERSERSS